MNSRAWQRGYRDCGNAFEVRAIILTALVLLSLLPPEAPAQGVQHLKVAQPGGMPGLPIMTGIESHTNGMFITWDGPSGAYQIYQKNNNLNAKWTPLGGLTNFNRSTTISKLYSSAFFRVSGPSPKYAGDATCRACHMNVCRYETNTPHASAFRNAQFKAYGGQTNSSCLPCHTVGYGLPTGFSVTFNSSGIISYKTNLAGVQCENCHGPAANHAANENDPTLRPRVELAATLCGGCHTDTHHEWQTSAHGAVTADALARMSSSTNNISSCGRCHSGSARLELIAAKNPAATVANDYDMPITCFVCHDTHRTNSYPAQLRNPTASTNYFYLTTSENFTNKYNANKDVNICAQCHNHRGAAWEDDPGDRAPHHSPQYNILLGNVGEFTWGSASNYPAPGSHAGSPDSARYSLSGKFYLTNQCISCHMQGSTAPGYGLNHSFKIQSYDICLNCHPVEPELLIEYVMKPAVSNRVYTLKYYLDYWGTTKSPSSIRSYGTAAWEYTNPGGLVWSTNSSGYVIGWSLVENPGFKGPDSAGQDVIPDNIKKARHNLYLILGDGSYGVHNPNLAIDLLDAALSFLTEELNK